MNSAFVGYEELSRSRRVLSTEAELLCGQKENFFSRPKKIQDGKLLRSLTYCCVTTSQTIFYCALLAFPTFLLAKEASHYVITGPSKIWLLLQVRHVWF